MRFILALLFALSCSAAHAQGTQCRTAPVGTSTSSCASEAFVTESVAAATANSVTAAGALTSGNLVQGGGGKAAVDSGIAASSVSAIFTAWTAYSPTVTSNTGTITTVSATGRFKQIGKIVHLQVQVTITTAGSGAGALMVTLPANALASTFQVGSAADNSSGNIGRSLILTSDATRLSAFGPSGGTFIANGAVVIISLVYEAA